MRVYGEELPPPRRFRLLGLEEVGDVEEDEFLLVLIALFTAHVEGVVVVVGDDDVGVVDAVEC